MFRDEYKYIDEVFEKAIQSTEEEDKIIAEADVNGLNMFSGNAYKTIGKTRGRETVQTIREVKKAPLSEKGSKILTQRKTQPLQAKSYEPSSVSSLNRRLPSRPTSSASHKAASLLSQQPNAGAGSRAKPIMERKRSTSVASATSRASGQGTYSKPRASSTSRPASIVNPKLAEINSKTSIGYSSGRPLAKKVQQSLKTLSREPSFDENDVVDFDVNEEIDAVASLLAICNPSGLSGIDEDDEDCYQIPMPKDDE